LSRSLNSADERVIEKLSRLSTGASALTIAKAALGSQARRHSVDSLNMIGLAIAARLCGQQILRPTKTNQFVLNQGRRGRVWIRTLF
jgi:hypothetical protein